MSDMSPRVFINYDPKAEDVHLGLDGQILIETETGGPIQIWGASNVTACTTVCARPCVAQTFEITFSDVAFGTCNPCPTIVSFQVKMRRPTLYDVASYLDLLSRQGLEYDPALSTGTKTGTDIATWFAAAITQGQRQQHMHDTFYVTATSAGAVLTLVFPCPYEFDIYDTTTTGGVPATAMAIVETVAPIEAQYTTAQLQQMFPRGMADIPGEELDPSYVCGCEEICVLMLTVCYTGCTDTDVERAHFQFLQHGGGYKASYVLFLNSAAPGYAAFIAQILSRIPTACAALTPVQGSSTPFLSDTPANWAAGTGLDTVAAGFTYPNNFQVSKTITATGNVATFTLSGVTDLANLAAQATAIGGGTFVATGDNLDISGAFVAGVGIITVKVV